MSRTTYINAMIDPFGRFISYLRVSVTDRCDFRCIYCMAEDMSFLPKAEVLSLEELDRLCSAFVGLGVRKLRLTGGEPLVRKNIMELIRNLSRHLKSGALEELTLTTNGSQLTKYADDLARCGVKRLNVSIDTLDPEKFTAITRWGKLQQVLDGLQAAKEAGLRVKINTVALKGVNDTEVFDLVEWVGKEPRTYRQVMDAWRTSCPRLTVWEEAVERGLLAREGQSVVVTDAGRAFLQQRITVITRSEVTKQSSF